MSGSSPDWNRLERSRQIAAQGLYDSQLRDREPCGKLFVRRENLDDSDGCVLADGHDGPHEFIDDHGVRYRWHTDMECDCDDCRSSDAEDWCVVYWQVRGPST